MPTSNNHLVFVQNRAKRAGAQVSLSRILRCPEIKAYHPFVLLGIDGWLGSYLTEHTIPHHISAWPSPRSLGARLGGLSKFARQTIQQLSGQGITPRAIVANDHQECLLALALAKAAGGIPVIAILRTPGMSRNDFEKYQCNQCDHLFARGEQLTAKVAQWGRNDVTCMLGSFSEDDLSPPLPHTSSFPTKILVAGSEEPRKGFADLIEAVKLVEQVEPDFPAIEFTCTGDMTEALDELTNQPLRSSFTFIGRVENFSAYARSFHLAIHPSRSESFGMAPLELLLAGVPTMISSTGITPELPMSVPWIFPPESPQILSQAICELWKNWPTHQLNLNDIQHHILDHFHISLTATSLTQALKP